MWKSIVHISSYSVEVSCKNAKDQPLYSHTVLIATYRVSVLVWSTDWTMDWSVGLVRVLPATKPWLEVYRKAQDKDPVCQTIMQYLQLWWPNKKSLSVEILTYWKFGGYFSVCNNLLMYGQRIIVPTSLRCETIWRFIQDTRVWNSLARARLSCTKERVWSNCIQVSCKLAKKSLEC